jgi:hypothetical protein
MVQWINRQSLKQGWFAGEWKMNWHGLTVTGIYAGTDTTTCAEGYETPRVELPPVTVGRDR